MPTPVDYFTKAVDITRRAFLPGSYGDPATHPVAIARLDRVTIGRFALDHERQTARLVATGCAEIRSTGEWCGIPAEIEPFAEAHHPLCLGGLDLRLMDWPLRDQVYVIVSEQARD